MGHSVTEEWERGKMNGEAGMRYGCGFQVFRRRTAGRCTAGLSKNRKFKNDFSYEVSRKKTENLRFNTNPNQALSLINHV